MADRRFFGIWAVRAAFVLALFGWGIGFYGPPVYLAAVIARTGWSLNIVSAAITVHLLAGVIVIANLPRIYRVVGLPLATAVGAVIATVGVMGWAIASHPWHLFVAAVVSGTGWVAMGAVPVNAIISRWYVTGRPSALARAYNGASIGGVLFSPLWVALIDWLGFPAAAAVVGVTAIAVIMCLCYAVFRKTPESLGQLVDGDVAGSNDEGKLSTGPLRRNRAFLTLAGGMAAGLFAQIGLLAHLFKLISMPIGAQAAGLLLGGGTAFAIVGRTAASRAITRIGDRRVVAAASYGVQALGTLSLLAAEPDTVWLLIIGVALFGAGIGNATSLPPLVAQADFPATDVPRVVALIIAIGQGTYAFAPLLFGLLLSAGKVIGTERHEMFFATGLVVQLAAAAMFLAGREARPAAAWQRGG